MSTRTRFYSTSRQRSSERTVKLIKSNPSSRSSSPGHPSRRIAKLNMYLSKSFKNSSDQSLQVIESVPDSPSSSSHIKRWDGNRRMTVHWDSVRRDPELWFPNGDCLIHLYERGLSKRGASLRIPLAEILQHNCQSLLDKYYSEASPPSPPSSTDSEQPSDGSGYFDAQSQHEIYIPAPTHLSREQALQYHLTTRNFFAWMFEKPLVGECLGTSLIALFHRMNLYMSSREQNQDNILAYIDQQGYTDFRECPDHALAILQFAERFEYRELWTDAFVHCTGMYDQLDTSGEFVGVSRSSQALITRAHIEMGLRLERAGRSLYNFLEDDLSGAYLGLGKGAQLHLERFRSFLHTYHVAQHGYWPPPPPKYQSESFPQAVYQSMYFDFRNLYEHLVDHGSGVSMQHNKPVDGGICVFQNVMALDKRNKFASLPHPLPLVPKVPSALHNGNLLSRLFGSKQSKNDRRFHAAAALLEATNRSDEQVMNNGLVREYSRFEKSWTMTEDETVSCADARKVRWILVYTIFQTLVSVTKVPNEVRDTEKVSYPLCCQIAGTPPWPLRKPDTARMLSSERSRSTSLKEKIMELGPDMDIVSARPSPLQVDGKRQNNPTPPRRVSFTQRLSLRAPMPIRSKSIEILSQGYGEVSPLEKDSQRASSHTDISPLEQSRMPPQSKSVSPSEHLTETSSPTISVAGGSSGWSANASEDGTDHTSDNGSDASNYGDDEDDDQHQAAKKTTWLYPADGTISSNNYSQCSFRGIISNPEVDQYIQS